MMATVADLRQLIGDDSQNAQLSDLDIARALVEADMSLYLSAVLLRNLLESRSADNFGPAWAARTQALKQRYRVERYGPTGQGPAQITLIDLDPDTVIGQALIKQYVDSWALKADDEPIPRDKLTLVPSDEGDLNNPRQLVGKHDLNDIYQPGIYQTADLTDESEGNVNYPPDLNPKQSVCLIVYRTGIDDDDQTLKQVVMSQPVTDPTDPDSRPITLMWERSADSEPDPDLPDYNPWQDRVWYPVGPTYAWAQRGNSELIPVAKLPTPHQSAGLNQAAVDARIRLITDDWAQKDIGEEIPKDKLDEAFNAVSQYFPEWAFKGNLTKIPSDKLPPGHGAVSGTLANPVNVASGSIDLNATRDTGWYHFAEGVTFTNSPNYTWKSNPPEGFWLRDIEVGGSSRHQVFIVEGQWYWRHHDDAQWTDWHPVNDTVSWAQVGNSDQIPADKLANAPAGGGGGLNQNQVDARIRLLTDDWAEAGNSEGIPETKLSNAWTVAEPFVEDFAQVGNAADVPQAKLDNVRQFIADWAETGNSDQIPADKLKNAPSGSGVTLQQVKDQIADDVDSWAQDNNSDPIPSGKLQNAHSFIADWAETGNATVIPDYKVPNIISRRVTLRNLYSTVSIGDASGPFGGPHFTYEDLKLTTLWIEASGVTEAGETPALNMLSNPPAGTVFTVFLLGDRSMEVLPATGSVTAPVWADNGNNVGFLRPGRLYTFDRHADGHWQVHRNTRREDTPNWYIWNGTGKVKLRHREGGELVYGDLQRHILVVSSDSVQLDIVEPMQAGDGRFLVWVLGHGCTWTADEGDFLDLADGATASIPPGQLYELSQETTSSGRSKTMVRPAAAGAVVATWAESGNTDRIPAAKVPVSDWALTGNNDKIPNAKLPGPLRYQEVTLASGRTQLWFVNAGIPVSPPGQALHYPDIVSGDTLVVDQDNILVHFQDPVPRGTRIRLLVNGTGCRFDHNPNFGGIEYRNGAAQSIPSGASYELYQGPSKIQTPATSDLIVERTNFDPVTARIASLDCGSMALATSNQTQFTDAIQQKLYKAWADKSSSGNWTEILLRFYTTAANNRQSTASIPIIGITAAPPTGANVTDLDLIIGDPNPSQVRGFALRLVCEGPSVADPGVANRVQLYPQRPWPASWNMQVLLRKVTTS